MDATTDRLRALLVPVVEGANQSFSIQLAEELQIPILSTKYILFEAAGKLYAEGIVGCVKQVGDKRDSS